MVDTKIKDLTLKTPVVSTDEFVINDVAGGNLDKKVTADGVVAYNDSRTKVLTNTTIDADGTGNVITNIENADIKAAAGIVYSKLNLASSIVDGDIVSITTRSKLPAALAYEDEANVFTLNQKLQRTAAIPTFDFDRPEVVVDTTTLGAIALNGFSDTSVARKYAEIRARMEDDTNLAEDGGLVLSVIQAGTLTDYIKINDAIGLDIDMMKPVNFNSQNISNVGTLNTHTIPGGTDTFVILGSAQTFTGAKTFTTLLLKVADIADANANKSLALTATASAVDFLTLINAATANPALVEIDMSGTDTNIGLKLVPKGTGVIFGHRETSAYPLTDESTAPTVGVKYTTEPWPYDTKIADVIAGLTTAGTGAALFTFDILKENSVNGNAFTTIFTTKPTIDASEFTSTTAATPMVLSVTTIEKGRRLQLKIDTLDTNGLARGAKIVIIGYATAV